MACVRFAVDGLLVKLCHFMACLIILASCEFTKGAFGWSSNGTTDMLITNGSASAAVRCSLNLDRIDGLFEGDEVVINFVNCTTPNEDKYIFIRSVIGESSILSIAGDQLIRCELDVVRSGSGTSNCTFVVRGVFLGRTAIRFSFAAGSNESHKFVESGVECLVSVIRRQRAIDHIFLGLVTLLVICANIGMGCKIELPVVKEVLMKPIAPVIGFCCQYLIMPLTAFAVVKLLGLTGGLALGYFAAGCAPGGGSSNMYTYLLGGDVSLSVTMTLVSIIASLGMIPLWLLTLGRLLIDPKTKIRIPYGNIMISLMCILIPIIIGILIERFWKRGAAVIVRFLRPVYIVFILLMFTLGIWSNLYVFKVISPMLVLAGCLLPYMGFLLSGIVAFLLRQPAKRVKTICIETGIQNTGLAIILMKFSLPQPEADLSIASPIMVAMFMPFPLWVAVAFVECRKRFRSRREKILLDGEAEEQKVADDRSKESSGKSDPLVEADNGNAVYVKNGTVVNGHVEGSGVSNFLIEAKNGNAVYVKNGTAVNGHADVVHADEVRAKENQEECARV